MPAGRLATPPLFSASWSGDFGRYDARCRRAALWRQAHVPRRAERDKVYSRRHRHYSRPQARKMSAKYL